MQIRDDEGGHGAFTSIGQATGRAVRTRMTRGYTEIPGLADVYLEDSWVLGLTESTGRLTFELDAVLTPEHPAYHSPLPCEQHCYAHATLTFGDVTRVDWLYRRDGYYTDASGERDLGNIDRLGVEGDHVAMEGDWGRVRVFGGWIQFEIDVDD